MKLILNNDITFEDGDNTKIYHYDEINNINEVVSLLKLLKEKYNSLCDFSYGEKLYENYDDFIKQLSKIDLEDLMFLRFKTDNNIDFFLDFINKKFVIDNYSPKKEVIDPVYIYYQYEDKIVKQNRLTGLFYELDDNNNWNLNQYLFSKYNEMSSDFNEIDFDESKRVFKNK